MKLGKLTVKKSVEAPEGFNAKREYEFTVTDTAGNQYNASGKQEAGAVIRPKDGDSVTLENLPEGTYTVIENCRRRRIPVEVGSDGDRKEHRRSNDSFRRSDGWK